LYLFWHGAPGFGLRLAGALYALACSAAAYRFANHFWGRKEACWAALLLVFFLLFDHPATVMTLAPDLLLVLPAIAAVDCAARGRAFLSGLWCSVGLAVNAKALLLLGVCLVWCWPTVLPLAAGFAAGSAPWFAWLLISGAIPAYWEQVWWFGAEYSRDSFVAQPWREGLVRTLNWAGFHAALVIAAAWLIWKSRRRATPPRPAGPPHSAGWLAWLLAGIASVVAGERFFPRYYFLLLPPLVLLASHGFVRASRLCRVLLLAPLLVPFIRFGPRYVLLASDAIANRPGAWTDVALNNDSKQAAQIVDRGRTPNDTLLVWGYRPDLFAYTQLASAGPFLDSQLLTGVIADRHLISAHATFPERAERNRARVAAERPTWIIDGLGSLNPALAITQYPELASWLASEYERYGQTRFCVVYRRKIQ
jgi:4-amino-4-deoxy-L-arabinose transferase-like glycosyltransferase